MNEHETLNEQAVEDQAEEERTASEELEVQAKDLVQTIRALLQEGAVRRVKVYHNERTLIDFPLAAGVASGVLLGIYMPTISAIAGIAALLGGCTVRIEREAPAN